ncbi:putative GDP-L-fucose synthase 2 [Thalassobium sp. R2A62]|jgi:nucleoside-diphosphate-sugar epimerase|nr:putative GDP-L-fucose synthase 2 [Thalassobium sp. R2A62]
MNISRLSRYGWAAAIPIKDGIKQNYDWFREQSLDGLRSK